MSKVVIVGAGVVGAAIAYELSKIGGLEVALIEEKKPAQGCTSAALGILMGAISQKQKGRAWQRRSESLKRYETLIPELESLTGIKIPFNQQGIVMLRFTGEDVSKWEKLIAVRHHQGWQLELWDLGQLKDNCPQIDNQSIEGAIYSPGDRQIDPVALTQALVAGASLNGVNCRFGVKVENTVDKDLNGSNLRQCCHVQTAGGDMEADWLVIAAGLGSTALTTALKKVVDVRPVIGQGLQLKLDRALGKREFQPVITGDDVHIVPLGRGEYWLGATVEFPQENGQFMPAPALLEQVRQRGISFCSGLAEGEIIRTWAGKRPRPEGQPAPIIGKLDGYANVLLATGHYRNGVLLAPATAAEICQLILKST
jgi:glycine/D-amino acid oxidase-like deaminating enzyme